MPGRIQEKTLPARAAFFSPTSRAALVIFARSPRGRVKTRLTPPLTRAQALSLHTACLRSVARLAAALPAVDPWLYLTAPDPAAARRRARPLRLPGRLAIRNQRGRDLGTRLARAWRELTRAGYRRVVFIGTDSPTLTPARLRAAFRALAHSDAVLGPTRDGGYYLIGLRAFPEAAGLAFRGIPWGTEQVCRRTLGKLRRARKRVRLLPQGYDVDTIADVERLRRDVARSRAPHLRPLRAWFRREGR